MTMTASDTFKTFDVNFLVYIQDFCQVEQVIAPDITGISPVRYSIGTTADIVAVAIGAFTCHADCPLTLSISDDLGLVAAGDVY